VSRTDWTECRSSLERILALANQEGLFIDREELDEIWRLREDRRKLTKLVVAQCEMAVIADDVAVHEVARLSCLLASIGESDRRNMERLAKFKSGAAKQLVHLYEGKQAVGGYRVASGLTPNYVDRRG